jgi:hypothetical protein
MAELELDLQFVLEKDLETTISVSHQLVDQLKGDFSLRSATVVMTLGKAMVEATIGMAVIALLVVKTRYILERELEVADILLCSPNESVTKQVSGYFTQTIREATRERADLNSLKTLISRTLEEIASMSFGINESAGNSINIYDMLQLMRSNDRVAKLLTTSFKQSGNKVDYYEGNKIIKDNTRALLEELVTSPDYNCYKNLLSAISVGQFQQVFCSIGWKPEVTSSEIYPHCVDTNLFFGFRDEMDYFVSAMGARKALITNAMQVSKAGYMSRKLLLLILNQNLSEQDDCGSDDYVTFVVESEDALKRLNGRYRKVGKKLEVIDNYDKTLIGKTINLRTPMTCRAEDGICKTCYGDLYHVNPFHISVSGVLSLTEQLTQMLLSSKHLLQINPEKVELPKAMVPYFDIDGALLVSKKHFKINIQKIDVSDEDELCTAHITIMDGDRCIDVEFEEGKELFIEMTDGVSANKSDNVIDVPPDTQIFRLNVENSELSTPLKKIIKLLESETNLNSVDEDGAEYANYHIILPHFLDLLAKSNIRASSVTIELILRELLRDKSNVQRRPKNFKDTSSVKFLKLTNALVHYPSAAITLAFERLNYVVENNLFHKDQESIIDGLF